MNRSGRDDRVDHGWRVLQSGDPVTTVGKIWGADLTDAHRCLCTFIQCTLRATQEDMLCDGCRATCEQAEKQRSERRER